MSSLYQHVNKKSDEDEWFLRVVFPNTFDKFGMMVVYLQIRDVFFVFFFSETVFIFLLFLNRNICCGHSLKCLAEVL